MDHTNEMQLIFDSRSSNESFARVTVAAFMTSLNPTVEEVSDVKTRSGMGFSFMEAFMDSLEVESTPGKGTLVKMSKIIGKGRKIWTTQSL